MSVNLRLREGYVVQPHLACLLVSPPGTKKSHALSLMARPLHDIDARLSRAGREAAEEPGAGDKSRVPPQLLLDDATREAVAQIHAQNPRGLLLLRDEAMAWVRSMNSYRGGKGEDDEFWLTVNSGGSIKVNRKGRSEPLVIPRPCIAVLGGITSSNLGRIRISDSDDGWIDRLLFCYPDCEFKLSRWSDRSLPASSVDGWSAAIELLWSRQPHIVDGESVPRLIELDDAALHIWRD